MAGMLERKRLSGVSWRLGVSLLAVLGTMPAQAQTTDQLGQSFQANGQNTRTADATNPSNSSTTTNTTTTNSSGGSTIEPVSIGSSASGGNAANGNGNADSTRNSSNSALGENDLLDVRNPRLKPPSKPGEFERWVDELTGRKIKRFGADLLLPSNRDYAVPAVSTIPPDYPLSVGDVISISLTGSVEGSANFEVDRDGNIYMPNVGMVPVLGVHYRDLREKISAAVGRKYRGYEVSVSISKLRGLRVYVTGFANNPGAYTVNSLSTLVNAVLAAGGPSAGGSFRSVKLYRNGQEVSDFDLYDLLRKGDRSHDPILRNEDVLFIPPAGQQVAVIGSVNEEAIYEIRQGESLGDMLRIAGGPTNLAEHSRMFLYRLADRDTVGSRQIDLSQAPDVPAVSGDIIQMLPEGSLQRPMERQQVIVRIEGEVNKPGNYYVTPGTPLGKVVEMAGGLTPRAFVYGTQFSRDSVRSQQRKGFLEAINQMDMAISAAALGGDRLIDAGERQSQLAAAKAYVDKLRLNEPDGRLVLDLKLQTTQLPGDLLVENNDHIVVPPRVDTVGVFGAVYRPASFLLTGRDSKLRVRDYVQEAGGGIRGSDLARLFVVRANGSVLTRQRGAMSAYVQPGDAIFVPIKTQSNSTLAKLRDIATIFFGFGISAAAIASVL